MEESPRRFKERQVDLENFTVLPQDCNSVVRGGGRRECRGKAAVIRVLPHTGVGSVFGGKNRKAEAPDPSFSQHLVHLSLKL